MTVGVCTEGRRCHRCVELSRSGPLALAKAPGMILSLMGLAQAQVDVLDGARALCAPW